MIRLRNILLEYSDSHVEMMNVLFVVDDQSLKKFGFIRHVISQQIVVGDIVSVDEQDSESIKDIVQAEASPELDLIVIASRGIYDKDPMRIIRNFEIIDQYAQTIDVPVLYFTLPTIRFIADTKNISTNWTEIERIKLNNILKQKFKNTIDLSNFDQDEYFRKDGFKFNLNAHLTLYKLLFKSIQKFDPTANVKAKLKTIKCNITKLQKKLIQLGYKINILEIAKEEVGPDTQYAIDDMREKLGYSPREEISNSLCKAIMLQKLGHDIQPGSNINQVSLDCVDPKYPNAKQQYDPSLYNGTNGIESKLSLKTVYGVRLDSNAAIQYSKMIQTMPESLRPSSVGGFRSYQQQYDIVDWDLYECEGRWRKKGSNGAVIVAKPGTSNHGIGKAIDVSGTDSQQWIKENGRSFGWYWGEVTSEDWHFTYDSSLINPDGQIEAEKGNIEKGIDSVLPDWAVTAKDWFIH